MSVEDAVAALGAILRTVEAPEEDDDDANDSEGGGRGETEGEVTKPRRMRKHPYTIVETVKVTE